MEYKLPFKACLYTFFLYNLDGSLWQISKSPCLQIGITVFVIQKEKDTTAQDGLALSAFACSGGFCWTVK